MAQKKTAGTKSRSSRPAAGGKKKSTKQTKPAPAPKRREIGAFVCLLLAFFLFLGFGNSDGTVINFFCSLLKGLFGWGFYAVPFALLLASAVLMFHHGRPVLWRLVCALLLPLVAGGLYQLFTDPQKYALTRGLFALLWSDGMELRGGGVLAGVLSALLFRGFSKAGAAVTYVLLAIFLLLMVFNKTVEEIYRSIREHKFTPYEPEPEYAQPQQTKVRSQPAAQTPQIQQRQQRRSSIDIPLDDVQTEASAPVQEQKEEKKSFFNRKPRVATPDQYISAEPAQARNDDIPDDMILTRDYLRRKQAARALVREEAEQPAAAASAGPVQAKQNEEQAHPVREQNLPQTDAEETVPETEIHVSQPAAVARKEPARSKPDRTPIPELQVPQADDRKTDYVFPPLSLLSGGGGEPQTDGREETRMNKQRLENTLHSFGINASISNIVRGPSVTRYEMELEVGVKLNKLTNLSDDIALALGASGVRIAAIPNKISTVGIEVPNKLISKVYLRDIIDSPEFRNSTSKLTFAIGKNISGEAIVGNISKLPHLLVAGTTGSGKSVCLNSLILSIMYKATPDEVKFIMVDPKMVEFKIYNGIPHLLVPVVTEAKKAAGALQWAVVEMMKRYRLFSETGARDIKSYNALAEKDEELKTLPRIVVVIDELADLMLVAAKEVEESICRVAQMGRAAGVHLVIATQSPRADVITGLMKANIPSRIALKVSSALESRIILDAGGNADKLVGNGDMLFAPIGTSKPARIQGTWVSDEERESIVEFVKKSATANYAEDVMDQIERAAEDKKSGSAPAAREEKEDTGDELLPQAVDVILETGQASVSMLQRRLKLGYSRAARIVDQMEERGIVGPFEGSKPRQILITKDQWAEMRYVQGTAPVSRSGSGEENVQQTMYSADDLFPQGDGENEE